MLCSTDRTKIEEKIEWWGWGGGVQTAMSFKDHMD